MNIADLAIASQEFRRAIDAKKQSLADVNFPWYPYGTLHNFTVLNMLLTGENRNLLPPPAEMGLIADIGAADGDTAFFLESLGYRVQAVDNPPTNMNGCRALHTLKQALNSKVEVLETDLDSQFKLPEREYDLAMFLGILYHLKNPYFVLESLARHARRALISTRITRYNLAKNTKSTYPDVNHQRVEIASVPAAYLVAHDETNRDATNFWMFTEAGLRRILDRTGWDVLDFMTVGNTSASDPATSHGDERAFCYVRSRHF